MFPLQHIHLEPCCQPVRFEYNRLIALEMQSLHSLLDDV
jgi:hypothetical protein